MPRGGPRPGAGRKPGRKNRAKEAKAIVSAHAESINGEVPADIAALSPLQVMMRAMAYEAAAGKWSSAAKLAADAAPYVHPRLSNVNMNANIKRTAADFSDEELLAVASGAGSESGTEEALRRPN